MGLGGGGGGGYEEYEDMEGLFGGGPRKLGGGPGGARFKRRMRDSRPRNK